MRLGSNNGENESANNSAKNRAGTTTVGFAPRTTSENVAALQNSVIPLNIVKNNLIRSLVRHLEVTSKTPGSNGFVAVLI